MFGGGKDMASMMKQLGMDMEEIDAEKVEITVGGKTLVFDSPQISKIQAQGQEIFQLQGEYREEESGPDQEDIELVVEKTGCSEEEAAQALRENDDVAGAVMSLQ
jgi:nascent polypeptide-associated complex subunit alpha